MGVIAEAVFDLAHSQIKVRARLHAPEQEAGQDAWGCAFDIDDPIGVQRTVYGETSLQALALALKVLSAHLYGSDLYKEGELGIHGEFGGSLSIPAPQAMLDIAPFPF